VAEQPYQSLYRRYRPQRFAEVRGQEHVTAALRNAVRQGRVGHAYLFSGPRGTGKTSTGRVLAKALNCEAPEEGEPCGRCRSCVAVAEGSSLDVHELDAASNNGVEAMRDLVSRAALGTPGRHKVYIVDEVHMLSTAASNTLLKTLEEPPAHVVFVLATTDPHRVLPTIRSRTQHFEFHLFSASLLTDLLMDIQADAGLGLPPEAVAVAVRRGNGSPRDALSALDQVAAAGTAADEVAVLDDVVEALCERDPGRALLAVAEGIEAGREPQRLATELVEYLRQGFLATLAPTLATLPDEARDRARGQASRLGLPALVRAMEALGQSLVAMRDTLDARVTLEVALVRLATPEADASPAALLERIQRLERQLQSEGTAGVRQAAHQMVEEQPLSRRTPTPPPACTARPPGGAESRPALGALRRQAGPGSGSLPAGSTSPRLAPQAVRPGDQPGPSRDDLSQAWGDHILEGLRPRARALYRSGRFVGASAGVAELAFPGEPQRQAAGACQREVEAALSKHFRVPVRLHLVVDDAPGQLVSQPGGTGRGEAGPSGAVTGAPPTGEAGLHEGPDWSEIEELPEADRSATSIEAHLMQAFPGAREVREL
jgi:DNA polymerase-3 subunit gamma/tau